MNMSNWDTDTQTFSPFMSTSLPHILSKLCDGQTNKGRSIWHLLPLPSLNGGIKKKKNKSSEICKQPEIMTDSRLIKPDDQ